jgi:hypothetical protein
MRLVIDTCCLKTERLNQFLSLSTDHIAVLTDFTVAEMFKGDALLNAGQAWEFLSKFPKQVIILKPLEQVVYASVKRPCLANRFIAKFESNGAAKFSRVLEEARNGNPYILAQLRARTRLAESYVSMFRGEKESLINHLQYYDEVFSEHERKLLRNDSALPDSTCDKFFRMVDNSAHKMMRTFDPAFKPRSALHHADNFCFRYALVYNYYVMRFYQQGMRDRKVSEAGNDIVDIVNATLSTYFNGLMTNDALPNKLAGAVRLWLSEYGAKLPKFYSPIV